MKAFLMIALLLTAGVASAAENHTTMSKDEINSRLDG
jgi:hypothetical protein